MIHLEKDSQEDMLKLNQVYQLKKGFGLLDIYIASNVNKFQLEYGINVFSMTFVEYLCGSIKNIYLILEGNKVALKSLWDGYCPYPSSYRQ